MRPGTRLPLYPVLCVFGVYSGVCVFKGTCLSEHVSSDCIPFRVSCTCIPSASLHVYSEEISCTCIPFGVLARVFRGDLLHVYSEESACICESTCIWRVYSVRLYPRMGYVGVYPVCAIPSGVVFVFGRIRVCICKLYFSCICKKMKAHPSDRARAT